MPQLHVMDLRHAATVINESCLNHGFFQVINHGVDPHLKLADKVVRPPQDIIIRRDGSKQYLDFTWSDLLEFT